MLKNVFTGFSLFSLAVPRHRGFSTSSPLEKSIEKVAIIGGGIMGTGVALVKINKYLEFILNVFFCKKLKSSRHSDIYFYYILKLVIRLC
jgi:hypothetical protein